VASCNPNIAELARRVNTSAAKLQNDFKSAYGCTIHDYAQHVRMAEALRKIENSEESIGAVSHKAGYKNPGYFSEIFRQAYGITPSEYRKLKIRQR
jgi:AraC-like DNA-binding protein